jgi:6-phosphogluconolactonase
VSASLIFRSDFSGAGHRVALRSGDQSRVSGRGSTGKFAYVANRFSNNVSAYRIGAHGALTPVAGSPFIAGSFPTSVAVDPTAKFAYVANNANDDDVSAYRIDDNGALTPVPGSPFAAGRRPASVAVDPTGKFVYVANRGPRTFNGTVSAYRIAVNGALTPVPGAPFPALLAPSSVAITPLVPFASSFAKLKIAKESFDLEESFTLGANSTA